MIIAINADQLHQLANHGQIYLQYELRHGDITCISAILCFVLLNCMMILIKTLHQVVPTVLIIGHTQNSGGSRIFERGFSLTKPRSNTSLQFELKTKKKEKVINLLMLYSLSSLYIYYQIISNKTTVIGASQSDCSIRVHEFQRGVRGNLETPPPFPDPPLQNDEEEGCCQCCGYQLPTRFQCAT